jgi:hypothetical protein
MGWKDEGLSLPVRGLRTETMRVKFLGQVEEGRQPCLADAEVSLKSLCTQVHLLERQGGAITTLEETS